MDKWTRAHWELFAVVSASFFLDGVLFSLVPATVYLLPGLADYAVYIFAANSLAFMAGALALGALTDRVGRRLGLIVSLSIYTAAAFAFVALYWAGWINLATALLVTSLIDFGVGGEVGPAYAAIAELSPPSLRGRAIMLATNFWNIGAAVIAGLSLWYRGLAENPDTVVLNTFYSALALAVVVFFARLHLPESPRWLAAAGRVAEAKALAKRLLGTEEVNPATLEIGLGEAVRRYLFRLSVLITVTATQLVTYNIAAYYSPYAEGFAYGPESAPVVIAVANLGASLGAFLFIPLIDASRRAALLSAFLGGFATAVGLAVVHGAPQWAYLAVLFFNLVFSEWAWASLSALESELFPTGVRSSVVGLVTASAWLINTAAVFTEGVLTVGQFLALNVAIWLIGAMAAATWALRGVESAKRRLEELI